MNELMLPDKAEVAVNVTFNEEIVKKKNELLEKAKAIPSELFDKSDQDNCVALIKEIKIVLKDVESQTKNLEQPLKDAQKQIKKVVTEFLMSLELTSKQLNATLQDYVKKEQVMALKAQIQADRSSIKENTPRKVIEVEKTSGMATTAYPWCNILNSVELYKTNPDFFDLVPKKSVINEAIKNGFKTIPGVIECGIEERTTVRL